MLRLLLTVDATTIIGGGDSAAVNCYQLGFADKMTTYQPAAVLRLNILKAKNFPVLQHLTTNNLIENTGEYFYSPVTIMIKENNYEKTFRKAVIAGNWKMNKTPSEAKALIKEMKPLVKDADCDVVLCVPYIDIPAAVEAAKAQILKSVQKMFTLRLQAVLSQARFQQVCSRKQELNTLLSVTPREDSTSVKQTKQLTLELLAALNAGFKTIICVGETLERESLVILKLLLQFRLRLHLQM